MFVVCVKPPDVPVIVSVAVPAGAFAVEVRVSTLVLDVGFVPQDAVTPVGRGEVTARVTLSVKLPASVMVIVSVADEPWFSETLAVEGDIQKPGTCGPAKASINAWPFALPQPVTRSYPATALNHVGWFCVLLLPEVIS